MLSGQGTLPIARLLDQTDPVLRTSDGGDDAEPESHSAFSRRATARLERQAAKEKENARIRTEVLHGRMGAAPAPRRAPGPLHSLRKRPPGHPAFEHVNVEWFRIHEPSLCESITDGWRLEFTTPIPRVFIPPYSQTAEQQTFIYDKVESAVSRGYAVECRQPPWVCLPVFCVPKVDADGLDTWRLAWDATILNAFLRYTGYRQEDITVLLSLLRRGSVGITADVANAYYCNRIHRDDVQYMGVSVKQPNTQIKYYTFLAAQFGLGPAGLFFNKLLFPIVRHIRSLGHKITFYGDDLNGVADGHSEGLPLSALMRKTLRDAGVAWNLKGSWEPRTSWEHIGYAVDTAAWTLRVKRRRRVKMVESLQALATATTATRRETTRAAARVTSASLVLGNTASLYTRGLYSHGDPDRLDRPVPFAEHETLLRSIRFVIGIIEADPSRPITGAEHHLPRARMITDASAVGIGVVDQHGFVGARALTSEEATESSTLREVLGVAAGLRIKLLHTRDCTLYAYCDNKGVRSVIMTGSKVPKLQRLALDIDQRCRQNGVVLVVIWAPRTEWCVQMADLASRLPALDTHDWRVSASVYKSIIRRSGVCPTIDLFADEHNSKCVAFVGRFPSGSPNQAATDAMTMPTVAGHDAAYACPPPPLILQFLARLPLAVPVVLIVPKWRDAIWLPLICSPNGRPLKGIVMLHEFAAASGIVLGPVGAPKFLESRSLRFFACLMPARGSI